MLATDLDGTFIGNESTMIDLWRSLDEAGVLVVFSTGRHLPSIERFYREVGTDRRAAGCVTMVGTEIWLRRHGGYVLDESWTHRIAVSWDRAKVGAVVAAAVPATLQPEEWQSPLKASYYLESASESQLAEIRAKLVAAGLEAKIVYSADRFLDLLPPHSGKGEAVHYLTDVLGIAPENVVTAGDTGNDLDMMRPELGFRSIVVGNASGELRASAPAGAFRSVAPYAAGIREGLEYYGWLGPAE
jgi:sucrose-6F-phosphate phosphohydrolase